MIKGVIMKDAQQQARVAVMIDCDNVPPDIVDFVMPVATQAGLVTMRRGYGNQATLNGTWSQVLAREVFAPCLQFQHASKKNTSDIALALEALEALLDGRADTFVLVTSDSDFVCLCRKLRERGATVYVVGDAKTPLPLRKVCDRFLEATSSKTKPSAVTQAKKPAPPMPQPAAKKAAKKATGPQPKSCPQFFFDEVSKLAAASPNGKVPLNALGQHLSKSHPGFTTSKYGHAKLSTMVNGYGKLKLHKEGGSSSVSLVSASKVQKPACTA
ncbi:NYN domain-containing protein [Stenotrophomonas sp.]|uniref:NYN domain-containing protein n=1 Tax=Stenotrophomonas sp. TaxID=69392 RepID=UPI0028A5948F|nr:NYN domain-containing protein [Stenotrophomonas sp.]